MRNLVIEEILAYTSLHTREELESKSNAELLDVLVEVVIINEDKYW